MKMLLLCASLLPLPALAQDISPLGAPDPAQGNILSGSSADPGFLDLLQARRVGDISGIPALVLAGEDMVFLPLPDGKIVGGFVFDREGHDVGAQLTGAAPLDIYASLGILPPPGFAPTGKQPAKGNAPDAAEAAMADAVKAIAALPADEKRSRLIELMKAMNDAKTPDDFALGLEKWGREAGEASGAQDVSGGQDLDPMPEVGTAAIVTNREPDSTRAVAGFAASGSDVAATTGTASENSAALHRALAESFWISIGRRGAPAVYMVLDPTCVHCARSFSNLQADIENGELELRVVMAPLLQERSIGLIAGIMMAENPAEALWNHELAYSRNGASRLQPGEFGELDKSTIADILANRKIAIDYEIPGTPFFAWSEDGKTRLSSGAAESGAFADADRGGS